ncbi:MAG: hypothetical protein EOO77_20250 [Oxalobacteraceae bacterium]|nr:MAG: hypothetical protein EOO77_20250 [Oxalobacteraceae bacterium]
MTNTYEKQKRLHHDVTNVGLRAQATAVGLLQLCIELRDANVLSEDAITRIKNAIGDELIVGPNRRIASREQRSEIDDRLNRLFAGEQKIGSAEVLSFVTEPEE